MKKQTLVSAGKCLGPKPPQPELQQQCELANVSLIKETQVCIYWEAVNDWFIHANRKENIKIFKLIRQNRYNCGNSAFSMDEKKCILGRRPLLDIKPMHVGCVRKDVCESVCNYVKKPV